MKKYLFVLAACVVCLSWGVSCAEEEKKAPAGVPTMEELIVTATRTEQKVEKVPANVTIIDAEDIKTSNSKSVPDLLRSMEGIQVRDLLGNGKSAQVDMRGFGETAASNTLVLVDGRRVNAIDLSGTDWTQIPLEQIRRIEIVRGTGSVLYGDNAVGGVINIITKIPTEKLTFSTGTTLGSYGRNKEELAISVGKGDIAASLFSSYDATTGYRDNSEFRTRDVGGKIVYDPAEFLRLVLSGSYHSDNYGLPGSLPEALVDVDRRSTANPFDDAETRDRYLKLRVDLDLGTYGSLVSDLSYRDRQVENWFPDPLFPFASHADTETWGVNPRYVWVGEIFSHGNTFIAGADMYWAELDMDAFSNLFSPVLTPSGLTNIDRDALGFYFTDEFSVLENLFLSVGARRERVKYDLKQQDLTGWLAPLDDTVTDRENAYSAGLTFRYAGRSSVFVRANRSLRFPLTDELVVYDFVAGKIRVNTELKPQRGIHYEAGIRHYFTPNIQANITLFRAKIKDEIFFDAVTFTNTNHPETLHKGIEIGAKADLFDRLMVFANYTCEKAEFRKNPFKGNDIPVSQLNSIQIWRYMNGYLYDDFWPIPPNVRVQLQPGQAYWVYKTA